MSNHQKTARLSQWVARVFMLILFSLLFLMPAFSRWYVKLRDMTQLDGTTILAAFYLCVPACFAALFLIDRLLQNIRRSRVFLEENTRFVRRIALCCAAVCLVTGAAGFVYPPLLFITVIMLFLCLLLNVVASVLSAATALREENDLTI